MAQIYVAAPFFDAAQTKRLDQVLAALQVNKSVTGVFSPRDDTNKAKLKKKTHQAGSVRSLVKTFKACIRRQPWWLS